jgi:hypothetical protein
VRTSKHRKTVLRPFETKYKNDIRETRLATHSAGLLRETHLYCGDFTAASTGSSQATATPPNAKWVPTVTGLNIPLCARVIRACDLTDVTVLVGANVTASDTNYWQLNCYRVRWSVPPLSAGTSTSSLIFTSVTKTQAGGGHTFAAYAPNPFYWRGWTQANAQLQADDSLLMQIVPVGAPDMLDRLVISYVLKDADA